MKWMKLRREMDIINDSRRGNRWTIVENRFENIANSSKTYPQIQQQQQTLPKSPYSTCFFTMCITSSYRSTTATATRLMKCLNGIGAFYILKISKI